MQPDSPFNAADNAIAAGTSIDKIIDPLNTPGECVRPIFATGAAWDWETVVKEAERIGFLPRVGEG